MSKLFANRDNDATHTSNECLLVENEFKSASNPLKSTHNFFKARLELKEIIINVRFDATRSIDVLYEMRHRQCGVFSNCKIAPREIIQYVCESVIAFGNRGDMRKTVEIYDSDSFALVASDVFRSIHHFNEMRHKRVFQ
jgi:riboflavin synthase